MENTEIARLEKLLAQKKSDLAQKQANCQHEFCEPKYDPEECRDAVFSHYEPHGSDPYPIYHYSTKEKPRWSRQCRHCDFKEYTYEQKPSGPIKPYFGK